jgi:anti-anti-sigma factor
MLDVTTSTIANLTVVRPVGRIDSTTARDFEESLLSAIQNLSNTAIVDLSAVTYVSSAGLRVFLIGAKKAKERGGALTICSAEPHVREVFDVTGFSSLLGLHATLEEARAALGS